MADVTAAQVYDALKQVNDPELGRSLVELDMIREVNVGPGGKVSFTVVLTTPACPLKHKIEGDCRAAVEAVEGVTAVDIRLDAAVRGTAAAPQDPMPQVKQVILVMSGKGGVGKSTVSTNLAVGLARTGAKVGLLDADIHGPSLPALLGTTERAMASVEGRIVPPTAHGVKVLSMGQFLEQDGQAIIWRGPIVSTLLRQFLTETDWGDLDYLVADLPPGTGDAALTMSQTVKVTGAVLVTTPQDIALLDVKKAVDMCREVEVPILGVVENMAYFQCPNCETQHPVFGQGGGAKVAEVAKAPVLGRIALDAMICEDGDRGTPAVVSAADSPRGQSLMAMAQAVAAHIASHELGRTAGGPPPEQAKPAHGACAHGGCH
jgi:ATP-binding protein involved in chromosome partitioning